MTVVEFPRPAAAGAADWRTAEMKKVLDVCAGPLARGEASGWDVGVTEAGEPQFYLLGPAPDYDCILSVSRLGRCYVLEDGKGQILLEHNSMMALAEQASEHLRRQKSAIVARIAVLWCAIREVFEEKVEPVMAEPLELLSHFAPQLAALA